jgi:hypothetical protein
MDEPSDTAYRFSPDEQSAVIQTDSCRRRINSLTVISSSAFAGGNMFIGLSMGSYWMSLDPLVFMRGFWPQFTTFLFTIMPLFLLTLFGLVQSARLDWGDRKLKRLWLIAIGLFVATSAITLTYHMPENLRLQAGLYSPDEAAAVRLYWLIGHVPRVLFSLAIPWFAMRAIFERNNQQKRV